MTLREYRADCSGETWYVDPSDLLSMLPTFEYGESSDVIAFDSLFIDRYNEREIIYDAEKWAKTLTGYMTPIVAHYDVVLRAFKKSTVAILAEYQKVISTEQHSTATPGKVNVTRYSAPNGAVSHAYTDGQDETNADPSDLDIDTTVKETDTSPDLADKIEKYATELACIYVRFLDNFEPLFKGVF